MNPNGSRVDQHEIIKSHVRQNIMSDPKNIIYGTSASETLTGTAGDDDIRSGGGNDYILAGDGDDWVNATSGGAYYLNGHTTSQSEAVLVLQEIVG